MTTEALLEDLETTDIEELIKELDTTDIEELIAELETPKGDIDRCHMTTT